MSNNSQSRKWNLTINNPLDYGFDHNQIRDILMKFFPDYFCLADEIATTTTRTPHTHIFIYSHSPIRFSTLKNRFPTAHIEKAYGSAQDNRDYLLKCGKWKNTEKSETSVKGSFEEWGNMPDEKQEKMSKMNVLIENIKDGKKITEIIDDIPEFAFRIRDIDILRQTLLSEKYLTENRDNLTVTYIWGASGTGITSKIYKKHNARDIYRITNYRGKSISADGYWGQKVLVFEEFNSQIPIEDMLNYLDIYPVMLAARYGDRTACYQTAYLCSHIPLNEQYKDVQIYRPETWKAFLRRIHKVIEYRSDGQIIERTDFK